MTVIREKANYSVTCRGCGLTPHTSPSATEVTPSEIIPLFFFLFFFLGWKREGLVSGDGFAGGWGQIPPPPYMCHPGGPSNTSVHPGPAVPRVEQTRPEAWGRCWLRGGRAAKLPSLSHKEKGGKKKKNQPCSPHPPPHPLRATDDICCSFPEGSG